MATPATEPVALNWGKGHDCKRRHWGSEEKPCGHCGGPTYLRDCAGRPAHKVCAERAATDELAAAQRRVSPQEANHGAD